MNYNGDYRQALNPTPLNCREQPSRIRTTHHSWFLGLAWELWKYPEVLSGPRLDQGGLSGPTWPIYEKGLGWQIAGTRASWVLGGDLQGLGNTVAVRVWGLAFRVWGVFGFRLPASGRFSRATCFYQGR